MAISAPDYLIIRELAKSKVIPLKPDILELGEANWYGDIEIKQLVSDIQEFTEGTNRVKLLLELEKIVSNLTATDALFDIAKVFYRTFLDYKTITAIDLHGTSNAMRHNLNEPLPMDKQFDILINSGTAEHVFNIFQFFKTAHERTRPAGLMIHTFPFVGWLDHGFYNINPTLIADLAAANRYEILIWIYSESKPLKIVQVRNIEEFHEMKKRGEIRESSMLHAVLRKSSQEQPFVTPMQGYYAGVLSSSAAEDWSKLRNLP